MDYVGDTVQTPCPFDHTGRLDLDDLITMPIARRPRASSTPWECCCCGEEREGTLECGFCGDGA